MADARALAGDVLRYMECADQVGMADGAADVAQPDTGPPTKHLEVYYDISAIPTSYGHPLDFRNAAMDRVEGAVMAAEAGEWEGAEIGMGEVNFGFKVEDFDRAKAVIRKAVMGTEFDCIREITRREY
ncbi:MAG: hypothetical protein AAF576_00340 [Pseudomonadota bacterium]